MLLFYYAKKAKKSLSLLSAAMMSWVQVWVDLDLFTTQISDKVLYTWYMKVNRMWIK